MSLTDDRTNLSSSLLLAVLIALTCSASALNAESNVVPVRTAIGKIELMRYGVVNGKAVVEGDIVLGPADKMKEAYNSFMREGDGRAIVINGSQYRWPSLLIPYTVDQGLTGPLQTQISTAVDEWNRLLWFPFPHPIRPRWIPRTTQPDYVTFTSGQSNCNSSVGRQTGQQFIELTAGCDAGAIMHEMGHAMGLWHEQSRADRDRYVKINWSNIAPGQRYNFDQHIWDGGLFNEYDYGSIMHYGAYDFAINPTIKTIFAPQPIGQRLQPSGSDVVAIKKIHENAGWGVRICNGTEAQAINFWAGRHYGDTSEIKFWFKWVVGDRREFPFPPEIMAENEIYIKGEGDPHAQINLCIVYNGDPKRWMTFDDDEPWTGRQSDHDPRCECR